MRVFLVSLGCDKNRVDSEVMLGRLMASGHQLTDDEEQAEAVIVNTCCFIDAAKEESIAEILTYAARKERGELRALLVTGCLAQRYREEIVREIPEVDAVVGVTAIEEIAAILDRAAGSAAGHAEVVIGPADPPAKAALGRVLTVTGGHEYLRIAEGCDKHCTYCVIPRVRGRYRSVPMEDLIREAVSLAGQGVTELILVAQETTLYGVDLYGEKKLPELLEKLCAIDGFRWIRLLYCYPEEIDDALIEVIAAQPKICHYLDLPIQSGSDRILKRMGRRIDRQRIIDLVAKLRKRIPDICLRTTLITGFPGETAEDHRDTMDLVRELSFDRLGVFPYSQEEGTPAAGLPDQVTERVKKLRRTKLMKLQQEITFAKNRAMSGRRTEALIEGRLMQESGPDGDVYVARTYRDAPEVDGVIFVEGVDPARELYSGSIIDVRITGAEGYDLTGVPARGGRRK